MDPVYQTYVRRQRFVNVALHEAGHAIAAMAFGLPVGRAWVDRSGGGAVEANFDDLPFRECAIASLAGRAAVLALSDDPDGLCDDASSSDLASLTRTTMDDRRRYHNAALEFCREHSEEIIELAERLLERGEMRGPDFAALCWSNDSSLARFRGLYREPKRRAASVGDANGSATSWSRERMFENVLSGKAKLPKGMTASEVIDRVRKSRS